MKDRNREKICNKSVSPYLEIGCTQHQSQLLLGIQERLAVLQIGRIISGWLGRLVFFCLLLLLLGTNVVYWVMWLSGWWRGVATAVFGENIIWRFWIQNQCDFAVWMMPSHEKPIWVLCYFYLTEFRWGKGAFQLCMLNFFLLENWKLVRSPDNL